MHARDVMTAARTWIGLIVVARLTAGCGGGGQSCSGGASGTVATLVTSAPGAYWKTDGQLTEVASGNADVTVSDASTAQTWEGFGGAFNELGWQYLSMLSEADRDAALHLLYGADGARFAFGRIPIGATDYAIDRYTLDETPDDASLTVMPPWADIVVPRRLLD